MTKEVLSAKVAPRTKKRLEEYANKEGISNSEATDRLVKQGLDVEESDMRLVPVRSDGGTIIEDELQVTQNQVQQNAQSIKKTQSYMEKIGPMLGLAIAWILVQSSVGIPNFGQDPWMTVITGVAIVVGLVYRYVQVMFLD